VYKNFFGLAKEPFGVTPDPSFLFSTAETEKTYASLLYGIESRKGLIVLIGGVGTGKTLLLRKLIEDIRELSAAIALVFNPRMNAEEFFDYVLCDFGVEHDPHDQLRSFEMLEEWLLIRNRMRKLSVLIVDEAQNLSPEAFEFVHALSKIETPKENLLQIILSGQRELAGMLRQPKLRPLSQKIALQLRTCPLNQDETLQYIAHRLRVAGGAVETVFTPGAIKAVASRSAGIPRLINLICEHALITGYADQRKPVGVTTVLEIAREFSLEGGTLAEEGFAEEAWVSLKTTALSLKIKEITDSAGAPPTPATKRVSAVIPETPLPTGAEANAGVRAETTLTTPGGGSAKSVATQAPAPPSTPPRVPGVPSPPNKELVSERQAVQPCPASQPTEVTKFSEAQIPAARQVPSARQRVNVPAPRENNLSGEFAETQSKIGPGPKEIPAGLPLITAQSPAAGAQGSGESANVAPRQASQPLLLKKVAAHRGFGPINKVSLEPLPKWPAPLRWAPLVLISMGLVLGGYYLTGSLLVRRTRRGEPLHLTSPSLSSGKSAADHLAGPHTQSSSESTGVIEQERVPTPPATSVLAGKAGHVSAPPVRSAKGELPSKSPKPLSHLGSKRFETQEPHEFSTPGVPAPVPPPTPGQLAVTSNVRGATVTVDGRSDPNWATPLTLKNLSPGVHSISVSKDGYKAANQSVTVEAGGEASINATLTPPRGEIDISTSPPGAEVLIDGKSYGPGPVRAQVEAGQHTFLVRQAGREPAEGKLEVQDQSVIQRTIDLPLKPPTPPALNISVTTQPPSATIYADGAPMNGKTPLSFHLSPGHHTLIIFTEGYRPVRREIDLPEGGALTVDVILSRQ
jgi:type II secretory pathway predicted ATPase ExeA